MYFSGRPPYLLTCVRSAAITVSGGYLLQYSSSPRMTLSDSLFVFLVRAMTAKYSLISRRSALMYRLSNSSKRSCWMMNLTDKFHHPPLLRNLGGANKVFQLPI